MKKRYILFLAVFLAVLACGCSLKKDEKNYTKKKRDSDAVQYMTEPKTRDGKKHRIAYVDYDEYLPAAQQFYYILMGLKDMGWISCEALPYTIEQINKENISTKEIYQALSRMDLGEYIEFVPDAFYYMGYEKEEDIISGLREHTEIKRDVDLVITFGTSAGKLVKDMGLSIPMVDFSATDPVASGIIESADNGSGNDNVWAQVEPSMPLRQLKYYHSIKSFKKLGILVYGDEIISGVPDIKRASEEVGFELVKYNIPEQERENEEQVEKYYGKVRKNFESLVNEGIDAFFLTVDVINDMDRMPELLEIFYEKKIPVYMMDDTNTIEHGALLIISTYDFENVGYFIADAAAKILNGATAGDLPCKYISSPYICLNYEVAKRIGFGLKFEFLASCDEIYMGEVRN